MKTHLDNHSNDDRIAKQLRQEFVEETRNAGCSVGFAKRVRERIEATSPQKAESVGTRKKRLANAERHRLLRWSAAIATIAASLLLIALVVNDGVSPASRVAAEIDGYVPVLPEASLTTLASTDAEAGIQLVNTGLGGTIQSVFAARDSLRDLLKPLRPANAEASIVNNSGQPANRQLDLTDKTLVASFTAKVLGLSN